MSEFVVFLEVAPDDGGSPDAIAHEARRLPGVTGVEATEQEPERSGELNEVIQSATLILTAAGGAAGATALLLDQLKKVVKSARGLRKAMIETPQGVKPIDQVTVSDFGE
jgi:hypothetical protein